MNFISKKYFLFVFVLLITFSSCSAQNNSIHRPEPSKNEVIDTKQELIITKEKKDDLFDPLRDGVVFQIVKNSNSEVKINGMFQGQYQEVQQIVVAKNGRRYAYVIKENGQYFLVTNGIKEGGYDEINRIFVSNNGEHYAYIVDSKYLVIDGKKEESFDYIRPQTFVFSENGGSYAYVVQDKAEFYMVINGIKNSKYSLPTDKIAFSSDGEKYAYFALPQKNTRVLVTEKGVHEYDDIQNIYWIEKSSSFIYSVKKDGGWFVVTKDFEEGPYEEVRKLMVSQNKNSYAYIGKKHGAEFVVFNGKQYKQHKIIHDIYLEDSGNTFGYTSLDGENWATYIGDGEKLISQNFIQSLAFFGSANQYIYVEDDESEKIIIQKESVEYENIPNKYWATKPSVLDEHFTYAVVKDELSLKPKGTLIIDGQKCQNGGIAHFTDDFLYIWGNNNEIKIVSKNDIKKGLIDICEF